MESLSISINIGEGSVISVILAVFVISIDTFLSLVCIMSLLSHVSSIHRWADKKTRHKPFLSTLLFAFVIMILGYMVIAVCFIIFGLSALGLEYITS